MRTTMLAVVLLCLAAGPLLAQSGSGAGMGAAAGSSTTTSTAGASTQQEDRQASPISVAAESVQFRTISVGGRLRPASRIVHQAPTGGIVASVSVSVGQLVRAGQELFSIRRRDDVNNLYKPAVVTARIAGRVAEVAVDPYDEVSTGTEGVVVIGTDSYALEAAISDKDAFKVEVGQGIVGRTAGGTALTGVLTSRSQEPDYHTGLFTLSFEFPNSQRTYIGEFVLIELPVDRSRGLFVRRDLVVRRYGSYYLWLVDSEGSLAAREVVLGPTYGEVVRIDQGLEAGERYLNRLTGREREGARVADPGA
ncbi:MAG: HlyD family efflux transporter periplasmic adaptor subunit [Spirochaetales bacterium]|nr:HlyD family efflux transporter periplasmic adaptor subunit [Spirochaetales bacterium]